MPEESSAPDLVELGRRAIECAGRGDLDEAMTVYGPDSVWDLSTVGLGTYRGVEVIRAMIEDWMSAYETFDLEIEEMNDLGGGVTLAVTLQRGRPRGSSGLVQLHYATVTQWADGLITHATHYADVDEARTAAQRLAEKQR